MTHDCYNTKCQINLNILSGESEVLQKIGQDYQELKLHLIENTIYSSSDAVISRLAMPLLMVIVYFLQTINGSWEPVPN